MTKYTNFDKSWIVFSHDHAVKLGLGGNRGMTVKRYLTKYMRSNGTMFVRVYGKMVDIKKTERQGVWRAIENGAQHGGKREGAGRKPAEHPTQLIKIKCTNEELAKIYELSTRDRAVAMLHARTFQGALSQQTTVDLMKKFQSEQTSKRFTFGDHEYPDIVDRDPGVALERKTGFTITHKDGDDHDK